MVGAGGDDAPELAVDHDRRADAGVDAAAPSGLPHRPVDVRVVADTCGAARAADRRRQARAVERPAGTGFERVLAGGPDHGRGAVRLVAAHLDQRQVEHAGDLARHRGEHVGRRRALGDERRHPAQRRLLVRQPAEVLARLGVGDRGRDQRREVCEAMLDAFGKPLVIHRRGRHHAPDLAVHEDRGAGTGADAGRADGRGDRSLHVPEVVDPRRPTGARDPCRERRPVERPVRPRLERMRAVGPRADHGHRAVAVEARELHERDAEHLRDLLGDGREHLRRRCAAGDERRDPAQRRLLLGEDRLALAQHLLRTEPGLDVGEGHDRTAPVRHVERDGDVGHREHRAVAPEEPVQLARHGLARGPRQQHRALGGRIRRAVRSLVVDGLVAVAPEELVGRVVAQCRDRGGVGEADQAIGIDDPDRLRGGLQNGGEEVLGADFEAAEFGRGIGQRVASGRPPSVRARGDPREIPRLRTGRLQRR